MAALKDYLKDKGILRPLNILCLFKILKIILLLPFQSSPDFVRIAELRLLGMTLLILQLLNT